MTDDAADGWPTEPTRPSVWAVPGTHESARRPCDRAACTSSWRAARRWIRSPDEAELLDLTVYFGDRVFAPDGNTPNFNKRDVIEPDPRPGVPGERI